MATIFEKMRSKWKSVKKGFTGINKSKTGKISRQELKDILDQWGIDLTSDKLEACFQAMDRDRDGWISYDDFKYTVGSSI